MASFAPINYEIIKVNCYLPISRILIFSYRGFLGDTLGSGPDHHEKTNITINRITQFFWFPSAYKSYVYIILYFIKCAIALCLKKQCTCLN